MAGPQPTIDELRAMQLHMTDYFRFWRAGLDQRYNLPTRKEVLAAMQFPVPGRWPGFPRPKEVRHAPRRIKDMWGGAGPRDYEKTAEEAALGLAERIAVADFKLVKVLGWGGLGVATLFETITAGGRTVKVVCKMDLHGEHPCVAKEIDMHVRTAGAKHVIQRVVLHGKHKRQTAGGLSAPVPPKDESEGEDEDEDGFYELDKGDVTSADADRDEYEFLEVEPDEIAQEMKADILKQLDANRRLLFIEFMERGRFDDCIGKAGRGPVRFPNRVLWRIFDCLFRAVIGMAYPDAFQPAGSDPKMENLPQISENCTGFPVLTPHCRRETVLHFDIDPLNILVGEFDGHEHNVVPILKIADLGLARVFDGTQLTSQYWRVRKCGKTHILAPEQTTQEWEHFNTNPRAAQARIAGNYNWWTNLYQIMFNCITLCEAEYPPVIEELDLVHPDLTVTREWTYGGYLLNKRFERTSPTLRHLIALCLVADPNRRPDMHTLQETIQKYVKRDKGPLNEADLYAQKWVTEIFGGAPPVPPRTAAELIEGHLLGEEEEAPPEETTGLVPVELKEAGETLDERGLAAFRQRMRARGVQMEPEAPRTGAGVRKARRVLVRASKNWDFLR
ncbi:hypothetical protein C8A01DRAFT_35158 [Parachaetomium inaequale]|uniref:Protein kinase domain-containing protein n=1 Tax=Parachaetomium inaequale TaxID=2588326 RepID=A0AAN6PIL3_9PEZI|nr:hypothetical protein C8A01DRAFT_35158 [Parachaetomium inaequale]